MVIILCPVCNYRLSEPLEDFDYCPCCGTQFAYHDVGRSYASLQEVWIKRGMPWWSPVRPAPMGWNPYLQLLQSPSPGNRSPHQVAPGLLAAIKPADTNAPQGLRFSEQIPQLVS